MENKSMSMRLTHSTSTIPLFDLVDDDDENTLVCQLDEQPHLINIRDEAAQTLLIAAAQSGSLKILKELLKRNPLDVNETDQDETTALIAAAKENHEQCAIELFKNGADLALTDKDGWGAVTWAAYRGHAHVVKHLLEWEGNPNEAGQYIRCGRVKHQDHISGSIYCDHGNFWAACAVKNRDDI
ncbi:kinase D-interacting substrate of 220 kDa-like isoform X1 [Paramuricea clavata]|uniref:Kinase D-interacting substrate of 220 kDa-like isoform X1 n=1 Tax=Paramuricea clavata TaxID=317549 RepID=A0A6S7FJ77_PARCT|nr:kinase D-interacting substrate of 220 kDa-like isoform X1 [Paramuricea clavata]